MNQKILILATGGTIASTSTEQGFVPGITGEELIEMVPGIKDICEVEVHQLMNIDSSDMQVEDWYKMMRACKSTDPKKYKGIVITHGTDTMCYSSAALSFLLPDLEIPVVLTGAQRPVTVDDSDGPQNVLDACRVAVSDLKGVYVVFKGKIINGSRAFKMYSKDFDAYVSRNFPYVGQVKEGNVEIFHSAKNLSTSDVMKFNGKSDEMSLCEDVELIKVTPATKPEIFEHIVNEGYKGVVIEGYGTGGISKLNKGMLEKIKHVVSDLNIPIVMISQCPYDGVNLAVYGVGDSAKKAGVISGNDMTTEVAVIKLMWILDHTNDLSEIEKMIQFNFCDEISTDEISVGENLLHKISNDNENGIV